MWNIWRTRRTAKVSRHRRGIGGLWSPAVCGCWLRWHDVSESEDTGDSGTLYPGFRCYSLQPQRAVFLLLIDGDASVICWHNFWRRNHDVMGKVCKTGWLSWIGLLWSRFPAKMIWPISRIFREPVNGIILISQRPTKTSETSWSIWQKRLFRPDTPDPDSDPLQEKIIRTNGKSLEDWATFLEKKRLIAHKIAKRRAQAPS